MKGITYYVFNENNLFYKENFHTNITTLEHFLKSYDPKHIPELKSIETLSINNLEEAWKKLDQFLGFINTPVQIDDYVYINDLYTINISLKDYYNNIIQVPIIPQKEFIKCNFCEGQAKIKIFLNHHFNLTISYLTCNKCNSTGISNYKDFHKSLISYKTLPFNYQEFFKDKKIDQQQTYTFFDKDYKLNFLNETFEPSSFQYSEDYYFDPIVCEYTNTFYLVYTKKLKLEDIINCNSFIMHHPNNKKYLIKTKNIVINPNKIYKIPKDKICSTDICIKFEIIYPNENKDINNISKPDPKNVDEILYLDDMQNY